MEMPPDEWFGQQAVYRISMGNFLMFLLLAGVMAGVRDRSDKRDRLLHRGPALVKAGVWLLFNALPFFFPNGLVNAYGALHRTALARVVLCACASPATNPARTPAAPSCRSRIRSLCLSALPGHPDGDHRRHVPGVERRVGGERRPGRAVPVRPVGGDR